MERKGPGESQLRLCTSPKGYSIYTFGIAIQMYNVISNPPNLFYKKVELFLVLGFICQTI